MGSGLDPPANAPRLADTAAVALGQGAPWSFIEGPRSRRYLCAGRKSRGIEVEPGSFVPAVVSTLFVPVGGGVGAPCVTWVLDERGRRRRHL